MRGDRSLDEKLAPQHFVADFIWAARALFGQPSVAFVSIAIWLLPVLLLRLDPARGNPGGLVCALVILLALGWNGVERIFFLARRDGKKFMLGELVGSVPSYAGRFLRLGGLLAIVGLPMMAIVGALAVRLYPPYAHLSRAAMRRYQLVTVVVPMDMALTFVTSALVFTTRSARQALRIGLAMIRQTWPRSGLYVLCPPLALNLLNAAYPTQILAVKLSTTAGLVVLGLLAKGSTAAFYLRERPASPDVVADGP